MRFCFVHAADLHLDTPFEGLGRVNPELGDRLRDASLDAFDDLVRLTIERRAEFLVLAGDVYDGADRGVRAQLRFLRGLKRLAFEGIRVFVIHGNHDPLDGWSAIRAWPANVTLFGAAGVEAHVVERDGYRLATVYGMSYPRRDVTENLALRFRRSEAPGLHIGLLHCAVGAVGDHALYSPCTVDDLRRAGMDYWALGHIHDRRVLAERDPWVVYPGNLQGRSTKPSERGAKGATVVYVDNGAVDRLEFVPCDRARFVEAVVDVSGATTLPDVEAACLDALGRLRAEHPASSSLPASGSPAQRGAPGPPPRGGNARAASPDDAGRDRGRPLARVVRERAGRDAGGTRSGRDPPPRRLRVRGAPACGRAPRRRGAARRVLRRAPRWPRPRRRAPARRVREQRRLVTDAVDIALDLLEAQEVA
jgi:predicted phosphodiesterase